MEKQIQLEGKKNFFVEHYYNIHAYAFLVVLALVWVGIFWGIHWYFGIDVGTILKFFGYVVLIVFLLILLLAVLYMSVRRDWKGEDSL